MWETHQMPNPPSYNGRDDFQVMLETEILTTSYRERLFEAGHHTMENCIACEE